MIKPPSWFEHFKDLLIHWSPPAGFAPESTEALCHALRDGKISMDAYMEWAQETFELPILDGKFFEMTAPNLKLWVKRHAQLPWKSYIFPVAEWDGCLTVACLSPEFLFDPEKFQSSILTHKLRIVYVLAPLREMQLWWQKLRPDEAMITSTPLIPLNQPESPVGIDLNSLDLQRKSAKQEQQAVADMEDLEKAFATHPTGQNQMLNQDQQHGQDNNQSATLKLEEINDAEVPEVLASLDELAADLAADLAPVSSPNLKAKDIPKTSSKIPSSKIPTSVISEAPVPSIIRPTAKPQAIASDKPESVLTRQPGPAATLKPEPSPVSKSEPTAPAKPEKQGEFDNNFLLDILRLQREIEFKTAVEISFEQMRPHFGKGFLLGVNKDESKVKVIMSGIDTELISNYDVQLTLETPSIFRIVAKTLKPYHGHIIVNDINEKFFEDAAGGILPSHVTMTPIIVENKLLGMLMGIGEKSSYSKSILALQEKTTKELVETLRAHFVRKPRPAAAS